MFICNNNNNKWLAMTYQSGKFVQLNLIQWRITIGHIATISGNSNLDDKTIAGCLHRGYLFTIKTIFECELCASPLPFDQIAKGKHIVFSPSLIVWLTIKLWQWDTYDIIVEFFFNVHIDKTNFVRLIAEETNKFNIDTILYEMERERERFVLFN